MLLIEAARIAEGGGGVLLRYLLEHLEQTGKDYKVILRPSFEVADIPAGKIVRARVALWNRARYFRQWVAGFNPTTILCFGNFPPPRRIPGVAVYTYFHRPGLVHLEEGQRKSKITVLRYRALNLYLRRTLPNTDELWVQSNDVKNKILNSLSFPERLVKLYPFFDDGSVRRLAEEFRAADLPKVDDRFIYVSNAAPHKNHDKLIQAWEVLARSGDYPELQLTLPATAIDILTLVEIAKAKGCRITNLGFNPHRDTLEHTYQARFAIFPSQAETLGLGLVEAARMGCLVLGAGLPYTFAAVRPTATFSPFDPEDIARTVRDALSNTDPVSTDIRLQNRINDVNSRLFAV